MMTKLLSIKTSHVMELHRQKIADEDASHCFNLYFSCVYSVFV